MLACLSGIIVYLIAACETAKDSAGRVQRREIDPDDEFHAGRDGEDY
ncbi:MAG: hypothetical protein AABN34_09400 [Acidobacteriota bacterium]